MLGLFRISAEFNPLAPFVFYNAIGLLYKSFSTLFLRSTIVDFDTVSSQEENDYPFEFSAIITLNNVYYTKMQNEHAEKLRNGESFFVKHSIESSIFAEIIFDIQNSFYFAVSL